MARLTISSVQFGTHRCCNVNHNCDETFWTLRYPIYRSPEGFRSKRSTEPQLILAIHGMAEAIQRLLKKLEYYRMHGTLLTWMKSFSYWALPNGSLWRRVISSLPRNFRVSTGNSFGPPTVSDPRKRPARWIAFWIRSFLPTLYFVWCHWKRHRLLKLENWTLSNSF